MEDDKKQTERGLLRSELFHLGIETLERDGWTVSRISGAGKSSVRKIAKPGARACKVSIRTSQDTWIAFPPKSDGSGFVTLEDVDYVVAVSVNDKARPTEARVHMIPADEARARFQRAYRARRLADHVIPEGRGIWLSLYDEEKESPVSYVGAGMGIAHPPIATIPLDRPPPAAISANWRSRVTNDDTGDADAGRAGGDEPTHREKPLTIAEAKRRLAESLGVPETAIKIIVEH